MKHVADAALASPSPPEHTSQAVTPKSRQQLTLAPASAHPSGHILHSLLSSPQPSQTFFNTHRALGSHSQRPPSVTPAE